MVENGLDKSFNNAFADAEYLPSPKVWENIAGAVQLSERRATPIIYKIAAVITLIASGVVFYLNTSLNSEITNTGNAPVSKDQIDNSILESSPEVNELGFIPAADRILEPVVATRLNIESGNAVVKDEGSIGLVVTDNSRGYELDVLVISKSWNMQITQSDFQLSMVPFWEKLIERKSSKLWVGAEFGAGNTNLNSGQSASADALASVSSAEDALYFSGNAISTTDFAGSSFSTGLSIGYNLKRKWMIESGLALMTTQLQATSNAVESIRGRYFPVYYELKFGGDLIRVNEYSFNNTLNYLSVPLKVGYKILDKRIGWIINVGVSPNIFLNQRLESVQFDSYNTSASDSFFRSVTLNSIAGTEVFIRIGQHYNLGLHSNYSFSLMDVTKPDAPFAIHPSQFQLGFNLRYLIK